MKKLEDIVKEKELIEKQIEELKTKFNEEFNKLQIKLIKLQGQEELYNEPAELK